MLKSYPKSQSARRANRSVSAHVNISKGKDNGSEGFILSRNKSLIEFYEEIWSERPHKSFISGEPILFPAPSNFLHVLAKGQNKYPKFKFYKKNIVLGTEYEHFLVDNGHDGLRKAYEKKYPGCWDNLGKLKEELLAEYATSQV